MYYVSEWGDRTANVLSKAATFCVLDTAIFAAKDYAKRTGNVCLVVERDGRSEPRIRGFLMADRVNGKDAHVFLWAVECPRCEGLGATQKDKMYSDVCGECYGKGHLPESK